MAKALGRRIMYLLLSALGLWLLGVAALYAFQDRLIYPIQPTRLDTPNGLQAVTYQTSDGLQLEAGFAEPSGGKPMIVFFHGNGDQWRNAGDVFRPLLADGYGLLAAEYRGYSGNPGSPSEQGLFRDGRAALDYAEGQGFAPDQVVLVGNSLGSGVATQLASERTVKALILVSPFDSLRALVASKVRWAPTSVLLKATYDNVSALRGSGQPTLIMHADDDTLIPLQRARILAGARPDIVLKETSGQGHGLMGDPAVMAQIDRFVSGLESD